MHHLGSQAKKPNILMIVVWDDGIRMAQNFFEMYYLGELIIAWNGNGNQQYQRKLIPKELFISKA